MTSSPVLIGGLTPRPVQETVEDQGTSLFLYSRGGGGKTTLTAGAAENEADGPVLMIDAEGGSKAVSDRKGIDVVSIASWSELEKVVDDIIKQVTAKTIPYKTFTFDNLSEYAQLAKSSVCGTNQPTQPQWGEINRRMIKLVRDLRNLASKNPVNVLFICWDSTERDETNKLIYKLQFTPQLQKEYPGMIDIIGYIMPIDGDPDHRELSFEFSSKTDAKLRRNMSAAARSIPYRIRYGLDNLPMADILNSLRRGATFPKEKYPASTQRT